MATQPTNLPVPSESPRDLKFNAGKIDEFVTSLVNTYVDRFGNEHYTIEGLRWLAQQAIAQYGWVPVGTFQAGATLTSPNQILKDETDGEYYRWDGSFLPSGKVVPAGSTPSSTGGIDEGAWISVGDSALRTMLASSAGASMIGLQPQGKLPDVINWVTPEQWSNLVDVTNDWSAAMQAANDYVASIGGGKVICAAKKYWGCNIRRSPLVFFEGQGVSATTIKAPDGWDAPGVIVDEGFETYASPADLGAYGGGVSKMFIDGNYENFAGTPSKMSGNGVLFAGAGIEIKELEVQYAPATGYVKLNYAGSPNQHPAYWTRDKGQFAVSSNTDICVKNCGNDCMFVDDADSLYHRILAGLPAFGVGTQVTSFWDTTRRCAAMHFNASADLLQLHCYGYHGGWGLVLGSGDYTKYPALFRAVNIIIESVSCALWARPTCQVQGTQWEIHSISMSQLLPEVNVYGSYTPGVVIQSGQFIATSQERRLASDYGLIRFSNVSRSGSNPTIGFSGTHVVLAGENNTLQVQIQRSLFFDPELGGIGIMLAGLNNIVKNGSVITGFLGADSSGTDSAAIQVQPSATATVDIDIHRCKVGLRWTNNASQPLVSGRINMKDNINILQVAYANANATQRMALEITTPGGGGNRQSALSAAGAVSVTASGQQTITVTGLNLPYVPSTQEVKAWCFNDQASAQTIYAEPQYINYIQTESTVNFLVFRVKVNPVSGAASGQRLGVKLN
ncbi:hypothetical protein [Enterobacter sp. 22466]|uniref:tail fiber/spike domain-containing protein n=1 Tax=Enterobacter sp. 22466 TaxID=3453924 RepID=UPI003F86CEF2